MLYILITDAEGYLIPKITKKQNKTQNSINLSKALGKTIQLDYLENAFDEITLERISQNINSEQKFKGIKFFGIDPDIHNYPFRIFAAECEEPKQNKKNSILIEDNLKYLSHRDFTIIAELDPLISLGPNPELLDEFLKQILNYTEEELNLIASRISTEHFEKINPLNKRIFSSIRLYKQNEDLYNLKKYALKIVSSKTKNIFLLNNLLEKLVYAILLKDNENYKDFKIIINVWEELTEPFKN